MTNAGQKAKRNDWIRRIIVLLRGAEVWQLRELYYVAAGYLSVSRPGTPRGAAPIPGSGNGAEERVQ